MGISKFNTPSQGAVSTACQIQLHEPTPPENKKNVCGGSLSRHLCSVGGDALEHLKTIYDICVIKDFTCLNNHRGNVTSFCTTLRREKLKHPSGHHKQPKENERRERSLSMSRPDDCASEGTAAFGVSSAAGAAVAELAPLVGAFMSLAICKACVEALFSDKSVLRKNK